MKFSVEYIEPWSWIQKPIRAICFSVRYGLHFQDRGFDLELLFDLKLLLEVILLFHLELLVQVELLFDRALLL